MSDNEDSTMVGEAEVDRASASAHAMLLSAENRLDDARVFFRSHPGPWKRGGFADRESALNDLELRLALLLLIERGEVTVACHHDGSFLYVFNEPVRVSPTPWPGATVGRVNLAALEEEDRRRARAQAPASFPVTPPAVPPIEVIEEYVRDRGWDDMRFWQATGIVLNDIRRGWLKVGPEQARQLTRALGRPEEFWLNLQRAYDAACGGDRISYWVERIHALATSKGWWDPKTQKELDADHLLSAVALMHVELSNQLERVRTGAETVSHPSIDMNAVFGDVAALTDEQRSTLAKLALIHSEISEAVECVLGGKEEMYLVDGKPEGAVVELIDGVIRSFDLAGRKGWDVESVMRAKHSYNETRPYRHGGKRA